MNNTQQQRPRTGQRKQAQVSFKPILISWLIVAIVFLLAGILFGRNSKPKEAFAETYSPTYEQIQLASAEIKLYGTYEERPVREPHTWESSQNEVMLFDIPLDPEIQEFVYFMSMGYEIDNTLVLALMETESSFRPGLISETNDHGLMQINVCNHSWLTESLGVTDFLNVYENIRSGMYILRDLFEKYETPEKVLMAYNMGEARAKILWDQGVYETNYSRKVLDYQKILIRYQAQFAELEASKTE